MHSRAPRWTVLAAVLAAAAAGALKAEPRFLYPEEGVALDAGRSVSIAWAIDETGARFHEIELVLSLDGGRTFPVRITGDLRPDTRSLLLTVPSLPASHARLALRAGDEGAPGEEEILFVSEDFSITADPGQPLEPALFVGGEWRTREALGGAESPALPGPVRCGDGSPSIHAQGFRATGCPPRPRLLGDPGAARAHFSLDGALMARSEIPAPPLSRAPADAPRRE